jgi:nitrogen fixation NifU-like protein
MVMEFRLAGGTVAEARFQTFGCGPAIAAGSMLTEMITGRTVAESLAVTKDELIEALGGLPANKTWCAGLAIRALHDGLNQR